MTKIHDIVSIDSEAVLSNAIQLSWYSDPLQKDENDRLAGGFVFGNKVSRKLGAHIESSSLPLFEAIRNAFGNTQASNIFTVIANYGHGKSHFALVLANYFGNKVDAPVVTNIIQHIETCSDRVTADQFRNYKKQTVRPHLVITLSGHEFTDLRQGFLMALRRALDANEATRNHPIKTISRKAATWLTELKADQLTKAEAFLATKHNTDVESLKHAVESFTSGKEPILRELSRELNGIEADFGAEANLKDVITDITDTYCSGGDAPFHRLLILFDELGIYAENWCHNRAAAGGFAPQEIFEACSVRRGKVCFVGFVQRELGEFVKDFPSQTQTDFQKWAGRMLPDAVYLLVSNLEEVISKLIIKKPKWKQVISDFAPRLVEESGLAKDTIQRYAQTWDENSFYSTVTKDCFPLHPLTTGILCSLDFTQGSRTIIGVVASLLQGAEGSDVSANGLPKWIRAVDLVTEFESSFEQNGSREFAAYEYAVTNALTTDAERILVDILRAIFLFKEVRMTKQNRLEHADIIAQLAGYSVADARDALRRLQDDYDAVRFSQQRREYEFTGIGSSRVVVLDMARPAIVGKKINGLAGTLSSLGILANLVPQDSNAREFKAEFGVEGDEWYLETHYIDAVRLSTEEIKRLAKLTRDDGNARGIVVNLLSASSPEIDQARKYAEVVIEELENEGFPHPFVIGVPTYPAGELEKHLLVKEYLVKEMAQPDRVRLADSYRAANDHIDKEISEELGQHLRSIEYVLSRELRLRFGNKQKSLDEIADELFTDCYKFRAPSNSVSMRPSATKGNTATAEIARQIILDELNFDGLGAEKQNIVKQVLIEGANRWGVLTSNFRVCEPKNHRIKEAWGLLGKSISKSGWTTFDHLISILSQPPFGYDDYTATLLIAAWIGKHKYELGFKDSKISDVRGGLPKANISVIDLQANLNKSKDFIKYIRSRISVQHSGQGIQVAANDLLSRIQEVNQVSTAEGFLSEGESILQTLSPNDPIRHRVQAGLDELRQWISTNRTFENNLGECKQIISQSEDIGILLRAQAKLTALGGTKEMKENPAFAEVLKLVDTKIDKTAVTLAGTRLSRIESLDALKERLETARKSARTYGRPDLEERFEAALARVDEDHARLKARAEEEPIIEELRGIKTNSMPLVYLIEQSERCGSLKDQFPETGIAKLANTKFEELNKEIQTLRKFVNSIRPRIKTAETFSEIEKLRTEILRRESLLENSPEQKELSSGLQEAEGKIRILQKREQEKVAARQLAEKQRIEALTATAISKEFRKIESVDQRFQLLKEILSEAKDKGGFSAEQKSLLRGLLK